MRVLIGGATLTVICTVYYLSFFFLIYAGGMALFTFSWRWLVTFFAFLGLGYIPQESSPRIARSWFFQCLASYFNTEIETELEWEKYYYHKKPILYLCFPHGVISFVGLSAQTLTPIEDKDGTHIKQCVTAVATAVYRAPVLRQIFSLFGIIPASRASIQSTLENGKYNIALYPGGLAEMFLCDPDRESIYFEKRKGCVATAMAAGADIAVVYMYGNTRMLTVAKGSFLSTASRVLRTSFTFFWGAYGLPIPRRVKGKQAISKIVSLPEGPQTFEVIDKYHQNIKNVIHELFDKHKTSLEDYKDKDLHIL